MKTSTSVTARAVGSTSRELGKRLVLACGFGTGLAGRLIADRRLLRQIVLNEEEAKKAVYGWRELNTESRSLWYNVDDIVRMVIKEPDRRSLGVDEQQAARLPHGTRRPLAGAILMKLPSGRIDRLSQRPRRRAHH